MILRSLASIVMKMQTIMAWWFLKELLYDSRGKTVYEIFAMMKVIIFVYNNFFYIEVNCNCQCDCIFHMRVQFSLITSSVVLSYTCQVPFVHWIYRWEFFIKESPGVWMWGLRIPIRFITFWKSFRMRDKKWSTWFQEPICALDRPICTWRERAVCFFQIWGYHIHDKYA